MRPPRPGAAALEAGPGSPAPRPYAPVSEEPPGGLGGRSLNGERRCSVKRVSAATAADAGREERSEGPLFTLGHAPRPQAALASASHGGGTGLGPACQQPARFAFRASGHRPPLAPCSWDLGPNVTG